MHAIFCFALFWELLFYILSEKENWMWFDFQIWYMTTAEIRKFYRVNSSNNDQNNAVKL